MLMNFHVYNSVNFVISLWFSQMKKLSWTSFSTPAPNGQETFSYPWCIVVIKFSICIFLVVLYPIWEYFTYTRMSQCLIGYAWHLQPLRMGHGSLSPHTLIYTAHFPPILVISYDKSGILRSYCSNNTNIFK